LRHEQRHVVVVITVVIVIVIVVVKEATKKLKKKIEKKMSTSSWPAACATCRSTANGNDRSPTPCATKAVSPSTSLKKKMFKALSSFFGSADDDAKVDVNNNDSTGISMPAESDFSTERSSSAVEAATIRNRQFESKSAKVDEANENDEARVSSLYSRHNLPVDKVNVTAGRTMCAAQEAQLREVALRNTELAKKAALLDGTFELLTKDKDRHLDGAQRFCAEWSKLAALPVALDLARQRAESAVDVVAKLEAQLAAMIRRVEQIRHVNWCTAQSRAVEGHRRAADSKLGDYESQLHIERIRRLERNRERNASSQGQRRPREPVPEPLILSDSEQKELNDLQVNDDQVKEAVDVTDVQATGEVNVEDLLNLNDVEEHDENVADDAEEQRDENVVDNLIDF
jgi:hypothetical protein